VPIPPTIRRPTVPARAIAAFTLVLGLALAGCGQPAQSSAVPNGLLALAGTDESTSLTAWDAAHAAGVPVDLPEGQTTWIAAGRANVLVATLAKGSTATSRPLDLKSDKLTWRTIKPKDPSGDPPSGPLSFATWDPGGGRYAALDGDLLSTDPISLVLVDPTVSTAFVIDLKGNVMAAPPAWIDNDRIAVVTGDASRPTSSIVDTTTGEATDGPAGARLIAASGNAKRVATMAKQGAPVEVHDMAGWLAGDGSTIASIAPPDGVGSAISFALDATGQQLAIAWAGDDGKVTLAIHDARADWRRVSQPNLGAVTGAVVAWLR
jgi:hypothetical protein